MHNAVTLIPKGKSVFQHLAEQGNQIKASWIFLHKSVILEFYHQFQHHETVDGELCFYNEHEVEDRKEDAIFLLPLPFTTSWHCVSKLWSKDIPFRHPAENPEAIVLLKME